MAFVWAFCQTEDEWYRTQISTFQVLLSLSHFFLESIYTRLCHKVYELSTVQRTEEREIVDYKYTALRESQNRQKCEKMTSEKYKDIYNILTFKFNLVIVLKGYNHWHNASGSILILIAGMKSIILAPHFLCCVGVF